MTKKVRDAATQEFLVRLGNAIRELRRAQGLHQDQLGARAGIPGSRIGEIERGVVNTSVARICAIAAALGISPAALLRREEAGEGSRAMDEVRSQVVGAVRKLPARDVDLLAEVLARVALSRSRKD